MTRIEELRNSLESLASNSSVDVLQTRGMSELAIVSTAISMKRQADALERLVEILEPTNQSGMNSIPECLFGIMQNERS